MSKPTVSIIIPAMNEEACIGDVLDRIFKLPGSDRWEVVVVDDGSRDRTAEVAQEHGARVIKHPENQGNGTSIKHGGRAANGDVIVFMDADGQHPPESLPRLLEHIGAYDMVVGSRTTDSDVSRFRSVGNYVMNRLARFLCNYPIADLTSGFRAMKAEVFHQFCHLFPKRYSYPTTITMCTILEGYCVKYVPMPEIQRRVAGTSNISPFRDGARFIKIMLRMVTLFNPMRVFGPVAAVFIAYGLIVGGYEVLCLNRLEEASLMAIVLAFMLFFFGLLADQVSHLRREMNMLRSQQLNPAPTEASDARE